MFKPSGMEFRRAETFAHLQQESHSHIACLHNRGRVGLVAQLGLWDLIS